MMVFEGYAEQDIPYECPGCNIKLEWRDAVGVGLYPLGGYRSSLKPESKQSIGWECPLCFLKSAMHSTLTTIKGWEKWKREGGAGH